MGMGSVISSVQWLQYRLRRARLRARRTSEGQKVLATATIKMFLAQADPKRLRTAEISNGTGKAVAGPRLELEDLLARDEAGLPRLGRTITAPTDARSIRSGAALRRRNVRGSV